MAAITRAGKVLLSCADRLDEEGLRGSAVVNDECDIRFGLSKQAGLNKVSAFSTEGSYSGSTTEYQGK